MRSRLIRTLCVTLFSVVALAGTGGCQTPDPVSRLPDLSYAHLGTFNIAVSYADVRSIYEAPFKEPYVGHLMSTSPEMAALQWGKDRIKAVGDNGWQVRYLVEDASVVTKKLETSGGVVGFFTNEQGEEFTAKLSVVIELRDKGRRIRAEVKASSTTTQTIPENASLADREEVWFDMTERMMTELNTQLEAGMKVHFKAYLR